MAVAANTYFVPSGDRLVPGTEERTVPRLAQFVHRQFRSLVAEADFPCVGARAAFRASSYRFGMYGILGGSAATRCLAADLTQFLAERDSLPGEFNTFVASFHGPLPVDEVHFERLVWSQLQGLHGTDTAPWDSRVSSDPATPEFEFSFGGEAFFVVGLHAASSRWSRRFGWPTLVFNGHDQFQRLRDTGKMARFQRAIRHRDINLQGSVNPNLVDFGTRSDARQYSGRRVEPAWLCPFRFQQNGGDRG